MSSRLIALLVFLGAVLLLPRLSRAADPDGDGIMDTVDPCENFAGIQTFFSMPNHLMRVTHINLDPMNDHFRLHGGVNLSFGAFDPIANGAKVEFFKNTGTDVSTAFATITLAPGAYSNITHIGWRSVGPHRWRYREYTPGSGMTMPNIHATVSEGTFSGVRVLVYGSPGPYGTGVSSADFPLKGVFVFGGQTEAAAGLCAETGFIAADCDDNAANTRFQCIHSQ